MKFIIKYKKMSKSMIVDEFEQKLAEQQEQLILKWRELEQNKIYEVID